MTELLTIKEEANTLRKSGKYQEALVIYRSLWTESGDKFDGCGLLNCMRNLGLFDEAVPLADFLISKYSDFDWCRNEFIWTYIQGKLNRLSDQETLESVKNIASEIMKFSPEDLALKAVVFKVLKSAKLHDDWEVINDWILLVDPKTLSTVPIKSPSGKEGWNDQELWYNYRIRGLIEKWRSKEDLTKAHTLADQAISLFPKHQKFFLRLKAVAYRALGDLREAEKIYQSLCSNPNADWWLLHEYAVVVKELGCENEALTLMYKAAITRGELKGKVSLFADIGTICLKLDKKQEALAHLTLAKSIREEQGWSTPISIMTMINALSNVNTNSEALSKQGALKICQLEWKNSLPMQTNTPTLLNHEKRVGLIGNVNLGRPDQAFAFIFAKDENVFCFKSDLPIGINNGDKVSFEAIPSFDKKKNTKSWRALNIKAENN